ncbi:glycosyltransferase [Duganella sp. FT92W]|uniref:Glycosyltransferase n=1 Tax=Pseudoduganella rivuli TaxID=2666085 RepID=A0A7X2IJU3_9BURK|nr:glycosyltransferase family 2 protein [Pseudoduganella rivuli]MRV71135.1 glycosyltransferase [Pseudoduganella rivuli]
MQQASKISIIITTYNRPDALAAVLDACFCQDDSNFEIIIADDGSTNNTRQCIEAMMARAPVPLKHVWQPDEGFRAARARNLGIMASSGDYVIFLDGDCVPRPDFVSRHRKLASAGHLVTGSRILLSPGYTLRTLAERIDLGRLSFGDKLKLRLTGDLNKFLQTVLTLPDVGRGSRRFSWRRIKSCNLGVWRADLLRVNGFDESFQGWGHEDSDLVVRLFNAGVMRKEGAFATEVYHLWHKENERSSEDKNRSTVLRRAQDKTTQALVGLNQPSSPAAPAAPGTPAIPAASAARIAAS